MKQLFVFGKPVGDESFTDRELESARLLSNFNSGINTFIISPRRWGKTSLVKKAIRESDKGNIMFVFADVFKAKTAIEFCEILGNAVLKQTSSDFDELVADAQRFLARVNLGISLSPDQMNPVKLQFGFNDQVKPMEDVLQLPQRIAEKNKIDIVVCIDEFQQIAEFDDSLTFQKQLRTVWQHQENVSYCLFGSKRHMMENLFDDLSKPFYQFGDIIYLKTIPLSYWMPFISERFMLAGKTITGSQIERICETVEYHSSYVQQLCWYIFLFSESTVTDDDINQGMKELVEQNTALFESLTEKITPLQMRFLRAVADGVSDGFTSAEVISKYKLGSSPAALSAKKALIDKGLIFVDDKKTLLSDPVLGIWLKEG